MTSGPTGLKIDWFETQPSPGFDRLAPASRRRESKMLFHQRNKKVVAAMTQNRPLHDHSPSPSASAFVIGPSPASGGFPGGNALMLDQKAAIRTTPNCAFRKPWLSLVGSIGLPREKQNESSVCCPNDFSRARD
jgi:hypothetical protein